MFFNHLKQALRNSAFRLQEEVLIRQFRKWPDKEKGAEYVRYVQLESLVRQASSAKDYDKAEALALEWLELLSSITTTHFVTEKPFILAISF